LKPCKRQYYGHEDDTSNFRRDANVSESQYTTKTLLQPLGSLLQEENNVQTIESDNHTKASCLENPPLENAHVMWFPRKIVFRVTALRSLLDLISMRTSRQLGGMDRPIGYLLGFCNTHSTELVYDRTDAGKIKRGEMMPTLLIDEDFATEVRDFGTNAYRYRWWNAAEPNIPLLSHRLYRYITQMGFRDQIPLPKQLVKGYRIRWVLIHLTSVREPFNETYSILLQITIAQGSCIEKLNRLYLQRSAILVVEDSETDSLVLTCSWQSTMYQLEKTI